MHDLEITAYGGGTFAESIHNYSTTYYKAQIGGGFHYGAAIDYYFQANTSFGINFFSQPTTGYLYSNVSKTVSDPLTMTYIFAEGNQFFGQGKIREYGGIGFGAVIISPSGYTSATKFAIDIHAGVKFDVSDRISLRTQLQLDQPVDGGGLWNPGAPEARNRCCSRICQYLLQFGGNLGIIYHIWEVIRNYILTLSHSHTLTLYCPFSFSKYCASYRSVRLVQNFSMSAGFAVDETELFKSTSADSSFEVLILRVSREFIKKPISLSPDFSVANCTVIVNAAESVVSGTTIICDLFSRLFFKSSDILPVRNF